MKPSTSRLKLAGKWSALVAAIYLINYFVTPCIVGEKLETCFRPHRNSAFDSNTWKKADPRLQSKGAAAFYGKRFDMVDSLLRSKALLGVDEQRLSELLGAPESASEQNGTKSYYYFLADQRQYPARSIWFPGLFANLDRWMLEVRLRDGKVVLARVYFT
jgi:hypothetical protein